MSRHQIQNQKNTDIESKEYPENQFCSISKDEFIEFYGNERVHIYDGKILKSLHYKTRVMI